MAEPNRFLQRFAFTEDPFEHIDAEQEPQLDEYFVPPPYFANVMGDATRPRSHVVLAPRGGGKTAQRRMVEARSEEVGSFLCVTYDGFDQPSGLSAVDADLAYHLNQICRRVLLGLLVALDENPDLADRLSEHQRQLLKFQIDRFLGSLTEIELGTAVNSLKNFGDRAREFIKKYAGPLRTFVNALMSRIGMENVEVPSELAEEAKRDEALSYHFEKLLEVAQAIGFESTYVLVDRVDEMPITDTAQTTFQFIWPLLADLRTLEVSGVAFKLFLWDEIAELLTENNFRFDRIEMDRLKWDQRELSDMLSRRLSTYSEGGVTSLNELVEEGGGFDVHALVAYLANGSPRDMYRLARRIVAEQTRISDDVDRITLDSVWLGVRKFSEARAAELLPQAYIDDLRRIGAPTFTNAGIASDVFRINENNARRKIQLWTGTGMVKKIDEIPTAGTRPRYLYGVVDPRLAIAILPNTEVDLILGTQVLICPECGEPCVTDEAVVTCLNCSTRTGVDKARSLMDHVAET
jgi:hypothetical protein